MSGIGQSGRLQNCYSRDFKVGTWTMHSISTHLGARESGTGGWGWMKQQPPRSQTPKWSTLVQDLPQALARTWLSLRSCWTHSLRGKCSIQSPLFPPLLHLANKCKVYLDGLYTRMAIYASEYSCLHLFEGLEKGRQTFHSFLNSLSR